MFLRFRKSIKNESANKNPPWENPDAQPPPLPTSYSGFSPSSIRKQIKPTNVSGQTIEPIPKPTHFNRLSTTTSPTLSRRDKQIQDTEKHTQQETEQTNKQEIEDNVPWRSPPSKRRTNKENLDRATNLITSEQNQHMTEKTQINNLTMMSHRNIPQKGFEEQSSAKLDDVKMAPLTNKNVSLHFVEQNGLQSNYESISTVTYSCGQSYSEITEKSVVSNEFSSEMVSAQDGGIVDPKAGDTPQKPTQQPSPTPWRKANASEMHAKDDASAEKAPWRIEKETVSTSSELKEVPTAGSTTAPCQFAEPPNYQHPTKPLQQKVQQIPIHHQQQQKHTPFGTSKLQQTTQQIQQRQSQPQNSPKDVPWRSPHLKKKDLGNTQSPSFNHLRQHTTSTKQPSAAEEISQQSVKSSSEQTVVSLSRTETSATVTAACTENAEKITSDQSLAATAVPSLPPQNKEGKSEIKEKQPPPLQETQPTAVAEDSKPSEDKENQEETVSTKRQEKSLESIKTESYSQTQETTLSSLSLVDSISPPPPPMIPKSEESFVPRVEEPHLPLPPSSLLKMDEPQSDVPYHPPESLALRIVRPDLRPEEDVGSPEYKQEPVTSRIQRFEQHASLESERKKEECYPQVKPVAPWVKKTSSGPVYQEGWDLSPIEGVIQSNVSSRSDNSGYQLAEESAKTDGERFVPATSSVPQNQKEFKSHERQDTMVMRSAGDVQNSNVKVALSQPFKEQEPPVLKHKQLLLVQAKSRPRTRSMGEYSHSYTENDDLKMPAHAEGDGMVASGGLKSETTAKLVDPIIDHFCDPDHPKLIQFQDISAAAFKIKSGVMNTPCTRSIISNLVGMDVFFKKEFNQYTGSFKERGARYTLLCLNEEQKSKGVIAASAGNHALALCYHGQDLGIPVTVVMPLVAPIMKVQACRQYGANILVKGDDIGECREIALKMAKEQELVYINGYDHPHILAGQGTMGLEIVEQVKGIDAVVVPVGGGGLIAGISLAVKSLYPNIKVIGVESERCASFTAAMKAKKPIYVKAEPTLADGLAVPKVGVNAFALASKLIDKMVTVKEEWIAIAILRLVEMEKAVVEGAGAAALAALLAGELPELKGKRVVIPLCGGNIDTTILGRCLERGMAADGRLIKFTVTVSDRPGGIADLTRLLANLGVSIKDMLHERAWIKSDIFSVAVKVVCETRDFEQMLELKTALETRYKYLRFPLPEQASVRE